MVTTIADIGVGSYDPVVRKLGPDAADFPAAWNDALASAVYPHLQQSFEHARLRERMGWIPRVVSIQEGHDLVAGALLLLRRLTGLRRSIAMIPCGPWWRPGYERRLPELFDVVAEASADAIFCRYNIPCPDAQFNELASVFPGRRLPHVWSYWNQPRANATVDIRGDFFRRAHKIIRYRQRHALRDGVKVRRGSVDDLSAAVSLLQKRAEQKAISVRDENYFRALLEAYGDRSALTLAEYEGKVIGCSIAATFGRSAWGLYAGMDYKSRHLYPSEVVDCAAMEWAQSRGCTSYDLGGTCTGWPPKESDRGYGVWHHKQHLGAEAVLLAPYCDLVRNPPLYRFGRIAEDVGLPFYLERRFGKLRVAWERLKA